MIIYKDYTHVFMPGTAYMFESKAYIYCDIWV